MGHDVTVRLLGPMDVQRAGETVTPSAGRQRALLATLALSVGQPVPPHRIVDALWGQSPPEDARRSLHTYVARLRVLLGSDAITTSNAGYVLNLPEAAVDAIEFDQLLARSDAAALDAALHLWRGIPFEDIPSDWLVDTQRPALIEKYLTAWERRADLDLETHRADELIGPLRDLTAQHPLRESLWARLLLALDAAGREAEALACYDEVRRRIADELGTDPSRELRDIHQSLLVQTTTAAPNEVPQPPAQLVGRSAELGKVTGWLRGPHAIVVVSGPPGVGKTAVATQAADSVREDYPDGALFVDLRGFAADQPLHHTDVAPRLLRSLRMPPDQIPVDPEELTTTYRSWLADKRVLIVLDNAASAEQIRPLLPDTLGCGVLVTSRNRLRGLLALESARSLPLDVLGTDDAAALLAEQLDRAANTPEPQAIADLADVCGGLPLALRLAAANLAIRPYDPISDYVAELRSGERLRRLDSGDRSIATAAFDISYAALTPPTQRLFRLLGLIPGPDFTIDAAAAISAEHDVRSMLDELLTASLIYQHAPRRYRMHDLIREYAESRCHDGSEREKARRQLFDWYVAMTDAALATFRQGKYQLPRTTPTIERPDLTIDWVAEEYANLAAAAESAVRSGPVDAAWHLADALRPYFMATRRFAEWTALLDHVQPAAEREGNQRAIAALLLGRALLLDRVAGQATDAIAAYQQAAAIFDQAGDDRGAAASWGNLMIVKIGTLELADAVRAGERSLEILRRLDQGQITRTMEINLALLRCEVGELDSAVADLERLSDLPPGSELWARHPAKLGRAQRIAGQLVDARNNLRQGIRRCEELGHTVAAVSAQNELARCHCDAGEYDAAMQLAGEVYSGIADDPWTEERHQVQATTAEIAIRRGNVGDWCELLTEEVPRAKSHEVTLRLQEVLAWGYLFCADYDSAARTSQQILSFTQPRSLRTHEADAFTTLALAELGLGDYGAAHEHATDALARHRIAGCRLSEARTLACLADAARAAGDPAAADEHSRAASQLYADIGSSEVPLRLS